MNTEEKIKVMQAFVDGKEIESAAYNARKITNWDDDLSPLWDWCSEVYRIKPEPKIIYVNEYKGELMPCHCGYNSKDAALDAEARSGANKTAVEYIELTGEIKEKLNIK